LSHLKECNKKKKPFTAQVAVKGLIFV
jgi:hypothetical protein